MKPFILGKGMNPIYVWIGMDHVSQITIYNSKTYLGGYSTLTLILLLDVPIAFWALTIYVPLSSTWILFTWRLGPDAVTTLCSGELFKLGISVPSFLNQEYFRISGFPLAFNVTILELLTSMLISSGTSMNCGLSVNGNEKNFHEWIDTLNTHIEHLF